MKTPLDQQPIEDRPCRPGYVCHAAISLVGQLLLQGLLVYQQYSVSDGSAEEGVIRLG